MSVSALAPFLESLAIARVRGLLVLAGDQGWAAATAQQLMPVLPKTVWMGEGAPAAVTAIDVGAGRQFLGREISHLVVNAYSGLHPNSLGAIAGAIKAGGLLVLITPPLHDWANITDPDYKRLSVANYESNTQLFIKRFAALLSHLPRVACWSQGGELLLPRLPQTVANTSNAPFKSDEQQQAYDAILKVATGHRRRPLLITAKRGRGKSASLGFAANTLVAQHAKQVILCAPNKAALTEAYKFIDTAQQSAVQFFTVEEMQRLRPTADIILVDEAAGIPVPVLSQWLQRYSRIVFATTNYGYEGYGQGFSLRFQQSLTMFAPQHKRIELQQAIRWRTPDPLEQCLDELLLLETPLQQPADCADSPSYELVGQPRLAANEALLRQCYALLVGAHYQTTPDDLRVLLDGPNISLFVARQAGHVVGVLMLAQEGGIAPQVQADIGAGTRRLKGHLAPQLLAANTGEYALLNQQCWRVVRIAVHPALRRQGIAKALLAQAQLHASNTGIDALCAVFGFTAELMPFWANSGFVPLTISSRKDSASGAYSGLVYKGVSAQALALQPSLAAGFPKQLMFGLGDYLSAIDSSTVLAILRISPITMAFSEQELSQLHHFAHANKTLESSLVVLVPLALQVPALLAANTHDESHSAAAELLVLRVLLKWPTSKIVERTAITGKDQLLAQLRRLVAQVLPAITEGQANGHD